MWFVIHTMFSLKKINYSFGYLCYLYVRAIKKKADSGNRREIGLSHSVDLDQR